MKDISFVLDINGASEILKSMSKSLIEQSGQAIADRASNMANKMTGDEITFTVKTEIKVNQGGRGERAIATVSSNDSSDAHKSYVANNVLSKAKNAGRVKK